MHLIVGLGNPGKQYEKTRHNIGFMSVDFLVDKLNFEKFKLEKKFKAKVSQNKLKDEKIIIAKLQTFMNNSGQAVRLLKSFYKIAPENITVIYDELDLPVAPCGSSRAAAMPGTTGCATSSMSWVVATSGVCVSVSITPGTSIS